MKLVILPVLILGMLDNFNNTVNALTSAECSLTGKKCLCIAFPGAGGTICTPAQNVGYKLGLTDKE